MNRTWLSYTTRRPVPQMGKGIDVFCGPAARTRPEVKQQ